jgi:hypothetical protein
MVKYICDKCNKYFDHKSNWIKHQNRKNPCMINEIRYDIKPYSCNYCNKSFTRIDNLYRHEKERCLSRLEYNNNDNLHEQYNLLMNKMIEIQNDMKITKINNTINSNNTNNVQQNINITINPYGKEDLSHITFDDYEKIFNKCNSCIPDFIELKHFNKNKPENSNIYISNMKSNHIFVYDGEQWNLKNKDEVIKDLYDNNCDYLIDKFEDLKDKLDESTLRKFNKFINKYENDIMINNTTERIRYILYNKRHIPLELKKLI